MLTADLKVTTAALNAIEIESDDVTMDLGGHVIRGPGESTSTGVGIYAVERADLAIRNGTIVEFGWGLFVVGADLGQASHRVEDLTVGRCGTEGISLAGGVARNIVVHDNGLIATTGYGLVCGKYTLRDVDARRNQTGSRVHSGSMENCLAIENVENGFILVNASLRGGTVQCLDFDDRTSPGTDRFDHDDDQRTFTSPSWMATARSRFRSSSEVTRPM
ncbi:MAG: hypothetical protein V2I67_01130 [Thermoanaerobaculales bacterium]|nr:hypothetical protein [Thermoanaerobaculales bacterium]